MALASPTIPSLERAPASNGSRKSSHAPPGKTARPPTLTATVAILALRRLQCRLLEPGRDRDTTPGRHFLDARRPIILECLSRAVRGACLTVELACRHESIAQELTADLPRERKQGFLPQVQALRALLACAEPTDNEPYDCEQLAVALGEARRRGTLESDAADGADLFARLAEPAFSADALHAEVELSAVAPLAAALQATGQKALAHLLGLRSLHGDLLLIGLADCFLCRALQDDTRLDGQFAFVHVQRPHEIWDGDCEAVARVVEQHAARVETVLDRDPHTSANGVAARNDDDAFDRLFRQGLDCYLVADYQRAAMLFSAALRLDPGHAVLYAYRGDAYRLLCEYDAAIADYSAALKINSATVPVLVQRANAYRLKGELQLAIADCTTAIDLDPNHAGAFSTRADAHLELACLDQAIDDYSAAIALQPQSPWAYFGRGRAQLLKEAYDLAIADFGQVLTANPHHVLAQLQRGDACRLKGELAQAILDYSEVLRHHPRNALAYGSRGLAFEQQADIDRAIVDYSQALRLDAKNAGLYCRRGALLRRKGELDRALADLEESIRRESDNGVALYNRGLIFLTRGLVDEARADFDDALALSPGLLVAYLARALAHDCQGQFSEGIQDCGRALMSNAHSASAYLVRGMIGSHAGRHAQALSDLTRALELDAACPLARQERGMVLLLQGDQEGAAAEFTELLQHDPSNALARAQRGIALQMQGDHARAVADFAKALELDPQAIGAGWHQSLADAARRHTTQQLADYVEGLRPKLPETGPAKRRPASAPQNVAPVPSAEETIEHLVSPADDTADQPPLPQPAAPQSAAPQSAAPQSAAPQSAAPQSAAPQSAAPPGRRSRPKKPAAQPRPSRAEVPPADETEDAIAIPVEEESPTIVTVESVPSTEVTAGDFLLFEDAETEAAPASPAGSPPPESSQAPLPTPLLCPTCRVTAVPAERLADGRVRCGSCKAMFLPTSSAATPTAPRTLPPLTLSKPNAAKRSKTKAADADDDNDDLKFSRKHKIIFATAAAAVGFLLLYYFFPSFDGSGANAPVVLARTSADELLKEYSKNRIEAAKKFGIGPIVISGEVTDIFMDKRPRVRFRAADNAKAFVEASFSHVNDMKDIQKNQTIAVRGDCEGWQKNVVEVSLCKVVANTEAASR